MNLEPGKLALLGPEVGGVTAIEFLGVLVIVEIGNL